MSDVVVYGVPFSNFVRTVRMTLVEKGISYQLESYGLQSAEIRTLHPFGKVPAFRHGDLTIFESQAICRYIDDVFEGPSLRPGTAAERAEVDQWVACTCDAVDRAFIRSYMLPYAMAKWQGVEPNRAEIVAALPQMRKAVEVLERHMRDREWVALDRLTLADLFLAPTTFILGLYPEGREALVEAPHLSRWLNRMKLRDSFQETRPAKK